VNGLQALAAAAIGVCAVGAGAAAQPSPKASWLTDGYDKERTSWQSAAVIAHRTKHGSCKTLDDLKKVPGLDFRKIQRRRDRLVCLELTR